MACNDALYADLKETIASMIISIDGGFSCVACSQSFNFACNAKTHVEAKHLNTGGFACDLCGFVSKTRDSLRKHTKNKHKF